MKYAKRKKEGRKKRKMENKWVKAMGKGME